MSLRRRLTYSLLAILGLFSANVATHLWGSYARSESMIAYRDTVNAAQLSSAVQQLLDDQRQQVLILSTLRETTDDRLDQRELQRAEEEIARIYRQISKLGDLSHDVTQLHYERLFESTDKLLKAWLAFYQSYNDEDFDPGSHVLADYREVAERLDELEQRQAFVALQRATLIDRSINLTDRITVVAFIGSIMLISALGYSLIRYTNRSLKTLKHGTQRIGEGDLSYQITTLEDRGELAELASAFNEMTGRLRHAMSEVQQAKDRADEANQAKSRFLANVSHELRTPLNAIIGYSEMVLEQIHDNEPLERDQLQEDIDRIMLSGRHLLSLINDILDLSKIETGKMTLYREDFSPAAIITEVCQTLAPLLTRSGNRLELRGLDELPILHNDATKFRQLFMNLLSNATKFTRNGVIIVTGSVTKEQQPRAKFQVIDTGIGMTEEQLSRVFEAFVQADAATSSNYGGTGLGLAICRDFCELMGGTLTATSTPGEGSAFTVLLPTAEASDRAAA